MVVRKNDLYFRVVKTIFYERGERVSKILFLTQENKSHISKAVVKCSFYHIDIKLTESTNTNQNKTRREEMFTRLVPCFVMY